MCTEKFKRFRPGLIQLLSRNEQSVKKCNKFVVGPRQNISNTDREDASGDPEPVYSGLNEPGEKVIIEMNHLGMIIDVSHVHDETF